MITFLLILLFIILYILYVSFNIRAGIYLKALCNVKTSRKIIALTYEGDPDEMHTPALLQTLRTLQLHVTFFVSGSYAANHPDKLREIADDGQAIGTVGWSSTSRLFKKTEPHVRESIEKSLTAIHDAIGITPCYFRPPFGMVNRKIARVVKALNIEAVGWNIRAFDTTKQSKRRMMERIGAQITPGSIIQLHCNVEDAALLATLLSDYLVAQGYTAVSLQELQDAEKTTE